MKIRHILGVTAVTIVLIAIYHFPTRLTFVATDYDKGQLYIIQNGHEYDFLTLSQAQISDFTDRISTQLWRLKNSSYYAPLYSSSIPDMTQIMLYSENYYMSVYVFPDAGKLSIDLFTHQPSKRFEYTTKNQQLAEELYDLSCAISDAER